MVKYRSENGTGWILNVTLFPWHVEYLNTIGYAYAHSVCEFIRLLITITPLNSTILDYRPLEKKKWKAQTINLWEVQLDKINQFLENYPYGVSSLIRGILNLYCQPTGQAYPAYPLRDYRTQEFIPLKISQPQQPPPSNKVLVPMGMDEFNHPIFKTFSLIQK